MKRFYLLILCFILIILAIGCTEETHEESPAASIEFQTDTMQDDQPDVIQTVSIPKTPVDFSLPSSYLICGESNHTRMGYVRPGQEVTLSARVCKSASSAAGGWTEFAIDGESVDRVPFFMDASDDYVTVKTSYILPFNKYLYLDEGEQVPLHFEARVLADNISIDENEADNVASLDTFAQGVDLEANDPTADAVIVSLKTISHAMENIAVPGDGLKIHIELLGGNGKDTRVRVYVNDQMVSNKDCYLHQSNSAVTLNGVPYYVPWRASGTLKIRVEMENGRQAKLEIPVATYDYAIRDEDIFWEQPTNIIAGNRVSIKCRIEKDSDIPFAQATDCTRVIFVVNGIPSEPVEVEGDSRLRPYMSEVYYGYIIPEDCTWPLDIKAVIDPGGLFEEKNEDNNVAITTIPISAEGIDGADLSVSEENMWYYPSVFEPGEEVQLFAAVHNGSSLPASGMTVKFFVDGVQIDPGNALFRGTIGGGQHLVFHEEWTVPDTLTTEPVFTVEIVPGNNQTGEDLTDNSASTELQITRPDISVGDVYVVGLNSGDRLYSNGEAQAFATIYNAGAVSVSSVGLEFYINGTSVGSSSVDLPPFGSREVSVSFTLPDVGDEIPVSDNITGFTGHTELVVGMGSAQLAVTGDPQDTVTESDEENNSAAPVTLEIQTTPSQGLVYVHTREITGASLAGVSVQIASNGKTASALTDSNGECTFQSVPYGPYELSATKSGFNNAYSYDEVLYEYDWCEYTSLYMDDYSYISGRVATGSGSGLADVAVTIVGTNLKARTNSDGEYSIKAPAGSYNVKYVKAGYGRQQQAVTLQTAQTVTKNIAMFPALCAYVYGYVYDENEEPLPGMRVAVLNDSGGVLGSSTTNSEGYYEFDVGMTADEQNIKLTTNGQGRYQEYSTTFHRGAEEHCDFSFRPVATNSATQFSGLSSADYRVAPWVQYHKPSDDMEVEVIYGLFGLETFVMVEDSVITHLDLDITPDYWYTADVKGDWSPLDVIAVGEVMEFAASVAGFILPLDLTIEANVFSSNKTKVWIKKIVILSDGQEVCDPLYPDTTGDYAFSPDVAMNWDDCLIKYYIKVEPNGNGLNPLPGKHYDWILIKWNPKTKEISIGNYIFVGRDQNYNEIYIDQD